MFTINDDLSIYVTRGDKLFFTVTAEDDGAAYVFQPGDIVRFKVYGKKDATNVVLQKDFPVTAATEKVEIYLTEDDTKIGSVISKPKDYWYEVELNPYDHPQTIIGYDEDGAKVFKLFPEGRDLTELEPDIKPEDIPVVDKELDLTSGRPVQNQAIARAVAKLEAAVKDNKTANTELSEQVAASDAAIRQEVSVERARLDNLLSGATADDAEVVDIRVGYDGVTHASAGAAVREQIKNCLDNMSYLKDNRFNLFTKSECEDGYFYDYTGERKSFSSVYSTKLIDISGAESLTFYVDSTNHGSHALTFWDENEAFMSYQSVATDIFTLSSIPEGARYIRLAVYKAEATPKILMPFTFAEAEEIAGEIATLKQKIVAMDSKAKYSSFSVLGDSYSTFVGFTDPVENNQYYPILSDTVTSVKDTWWHKFATESGIPLLANNSFSGSRIATGKKDGQSFVDRVNNIGKPGLVIVFGATNDISSEIGEYKYSDWTEGDLMYFRPALSYLLNYLAEHNPGAKVVFVLNNGLGTTLTESVRVICEHHGVDLLELVDIDKANGHPTANGMAQIKDQLTAFLGIE